MSASAILLTFAATAFADHSCIEEFPDGAKIERKLPLPRTWFMVGGGSILNANMHEALRKQYGHAYSTGVEEGPFGIICLITADGNVTVSTNSFGVNVDYSKDVPKCESCKTKAQSGANLASGTKLRLGMKRSEAARIIGVAISDRGTSTIEFEETIPSKNGHIWHVETLRLTFDRNVLVRLIVSDYRESA